MSLVGADQRFKLFRSDINRGGGENIKDLMLKASGEVCVELGADDYFIRNDVFTKIKEMYDKFPKCDSTTGSFMVVPRTVICDNPPDLLWWKRWSCCKPLTWKTEVGKSALDEFKGVQVDPNTGLMPRYGWDVAIYFPIMYRSLRHKHLYEVLYAYRTHDNNDMVDHREDQIITERRMGDYFDKILMKTMPWWPQEEKDKYAT